MLTFKQLVGEQIRTARKLRGMTQERLAELSGLSLSYISDLERAGRNVSLDSLEKVIRVLNITPSQLFEISNEADQSTQNNGTRKKLEALNILLANRPVEDVEFIIAVVREYIDAIDRKKR